MKKEPVIEFENFSFRYFSQSEPTLRNINLKIYKGEKVLIIGPSGSGKSTLGHCINGLIPWSYEGNLEGSVKIYGKARKSIFDTSEVIGTILQDSDSQFVGLSVAEDIAFSLENECYNKETMEKKVQDVANSLEIEDILEHSPFELSGGQKQKISLAGVLINQTDILLFDEPLASLDPLSGKKTIEIIDELHKNHEKTIIIIEHRLEEVLQREVDRIILLDDGMIISDSNVTNLLKSDILKKHGLKEPLYISALKYLGEPINTGYLWDVQKTYINEESLFKIHNFKLQIRDSEILKIENLNFSYNRWKNEVDNINLSIKKGEFLAVIGKNGAGKSTLSKLICGFIKEDSGDIKFKDESMKNSSIKSRAEKIAYVLQNPNEMISKSSIYDEVSLGLRLRNIPEKTIKIKVTETLKVCGLLPFINWPISALSYGQKKRVTIASLLVLDPEILILDEPTAGQDYKHYLEIMKFLRKLNNQGITIILITHDMDLMLHWTERVVVISNGKIIADDSPWKILSEKDILEEANLKQTSLYELATILEVQDKKAFVKSFSEYERSSYEN